MKLSVVIPVYNVAPWLRQCLHSVVDEADADVEVVCVDDGSADGSGKILDDFAAAGQDRDCGFKALRQQNAGAGAARNTGLEAATGEWIMFLDGDDILARGWLSVVREMATRHPSAQMLGFGRTETFPVLPVTTGESREVDVSRVVGFDVYERGMWQYAYRHDLIDGLRFKHIIRVEDKLFQGEALLRATRVAVVNAPVYGYRQRRGSVIHTNWRRDNFEAELSWRIQWLESMTRAGKTMDAKLWRFMGLCFLEYIPRHLQDVKDPSLHSELESKWFETLHAAAKYRFAAWQRTAMRVLGATKSRTATMLLCRLPFMLKQMMGRHHPQPARRRILFCGVGFGRGGLASAFLPVARTLKDAGYEVKVLLPHASDASHLGILSEYEIGPAFRWKASGLWAGRALRTFHLLTGGRFRFLFARHIPHDAFVVFGASCCMEWSGYSKKPTWGFLHSDPMTGPSSLLKPLIIRDMRRSAARCRGMFAVSEAMKTAWHEIGIDSVTLRIPCAELPPADEHRPASDPTRCVCVGRLSWEKGQDRLLEAIARVPGLSLTLVGEGTYRTELEHQVDRLGLSGRVNFAGWQDDPSPFVASAGLLVNPSRQEGLGLATVESLLAGTPVLATDVSGSREALSCGQYGMLVDDSVDGLAAGLAAYSADHHACDPKIGFAAVREELRSMSHASAERLSQINWTEAS